MPERKSDKNFAGKNKSRRPYRNRRGGPRRRKSGSQNPEHSLKNLPVEKIPADRVIEVYDQLQSDYQKARARYYEMYFRTNPQQRHRHFQQMMIALNKVRVFESEASGDQKESLLKKTEGLPLDISYSERRGLPIVGDTPFAGPFEEQHFLPSQIERDNYRDDREISEGTKEDYERYKSARENH